MTTAEKNNERRTVLYNFLLTLGDKWIRQELLLEALQEYYPGALNKDMHNSSARRVLSDDIQKINSSLAFEKLIFCGARGIKLATYDESFKYISNQYKSIFGKLKRLRTLEKKAASDGQYLLIDGKHIDSFIDKLERSKSQCHMA